MEKAIRYGMAALLMDLADVGGNVKDGCHIASMGGTWMMLTYGFGGMKDDDGRLSFWPRRAPQDNAILRFPVTYRGQMLEVEIGVETVEYTLREGELASGAVQDSPQQSDARFRSARSTTGITHLRASARSIWWHMAARQSSAPSRLTNGTHSVQPVAISTIVSVWTVSMRQHGCTSTSSNRRSS
jgi:hypothetical protein